LFSKARLGAGLAFLLLLPLPVAAYIIDTWSFVNMGSVLSDTSPDHKTLTFTDTPMPPKADSSMGTSTVTASAGETLSAHLDLTGMTITKGNLTVTIQVGSTMLPPQTFSGTITTADFGPIDLAAGRQNIVVNFTFSSNATFTYTPSTTSNLVFR
jgi:hypothetical protein